MGTEKKYTVRRAGLLCALAVLLVGGTGCLTMQAIDNAKNRAERARAEEREKELAKQREREQIKQTTPPANKSVNP